MCKVLKDAPHYLNHRSLSDGAFSTDKTRVSSTARSHGPATWAVPFPPFGPRLGAEREAVDVLPQPARHQRLQAHPTPAAASRRCCLRHRRPTRGPRARGSLPRLASLGTAGFSPRTPPAPPSAPRRRSKRDERNAGWPLRPPCPGAGPAGERLEPRRPRPRSPTALTGLAAAGPHRRRRRTGSAGTYRVPAGEGRGLSRRAGGRGRSAAGPGPGSARSAPAEPPLLAKAGLAGTKKVKGRWSKTACREK